MKLRGIVLSAFCLTILAWNMALSTQRKQVKGHLLRVKQENVRLKVACPGKVEPKVDALIRSELDGRKKAVLVQAGDVVKKGQKLMEISDELLRVELIQKRSAYNNARVDMNKARKDFHLEINLYKQQAVSERDVENERQNYEKAKQNFALSAHELKLSERKALGVNVVSPMDGVVLQIYVDKEENISQGRELIKVARLDQFVILGKIDELNIAEVKEGQLALIKVDAYPDVELVGKVARIGAQAAEGTFAEVEAKIDVLDTKGVELKPNLSAEVSIIIGDIPNGIVIPADALRHSSKGAYVLASKGIGWLAKQPVSVKKISAGQAIIESGLEPGQAILVPKNE